MIEGVRQDKNLSILGWLEWKVLAKGIGGEVGD